MSATSFLRIFTFSLGALLLPTAGQNTPASAADRGAVYAQSHLRGPAVHGGHRSAARRAHYMRHAGRHVGKNAGGVFIRPPHLGIPYANGCREQTIVTDDVVVHKLICPRNRVLPYSGGGEAWSYREFSKTADFRQSRAWQGRFQPSRSRPHRYTGFLP